MRNGEGEESGKEAMIGGKRSWRQKGEVQCTGDRDVAGFDGGP